MRKFSLLAMFFILMMVSVPGYSQSETGSDNSGKKGSLFFGTGLYHSFFNNRVLPLFSEVDVERLSMIKAGAYWEMPTGKGYTSFGLESGYSFGDRFGGGGGTDFIPLMLSATYAHPLIGGFSIGPSFKAGILGALNSEGFGVRPLLEAKLEAELRFGFLPVSIYAAGGVDFFPASINVLPIVEAGLRVPRGKWGRSGAAASESGGQPGVAGSGAGSSGAGAAGLAGSVGTAGAGTGQGAQGTAAGGQTGAAGLAGSVGTAGAGTGQGAQGTAAGGQAGAAGAGAAAIAGAGAAGLAEQTSPVVTAVSVTPSFTLVTKGQVQQFGAAVSGNNNPAQTVTWAVLGGGSGTSINSNGLLNVAPNESASSLIVRATSTVDTSKSGTAAVAAIDPAAALPTRSSSVSGAAAGTGTAAAGTSGQTGSGTGQGAAAAGTAGAAGTSAAGTGTTGAGTGAAAVAGTSGQTGSGTGQSAAAAGTAAGAGAGTIHQMFFRAVYFEPDSAALLESSRLILEGVGHQLQVDPTLQVVLRSYTAPFGTAEGREMVSESRKDFCRDYLVESYGVAPSRITTESWASERMPEYARGDDWETYRCVEFIVGN